MAKFIGNLILLIRSAAKFLAKKIGKEKSLSPGKKAIALHVVGHSLNDNQH
jgi:hypothetical protein